MDRVLTVLRTLLLVAGLVAAVYVAIGPGGDRPDLDDELDRIDSGHDLNNDRAQGAPQQQVVNGWTSHDYLELLATQQDATADSLQRMHLLLGLLVAVVAVDGLTRRAPSGGQDLPAGPSGDGAAEPPRDDPARPHEDLDGPADGPGDQPPAGESRRPPPPVNYPDGT